MLQESMERVKVEDKASWALDHTREICDLTFDIVDVPSKRRFLENLAAYYMVMEGIFFYYGLAQILSMGRQNKMIGVAEMFQYILRDEVMHLRFCIKAINQIVHENKPDLWDKL